MEPKIWGPPAWNFLHTVTLNYPENPTNEDKKNYYVFFNTLKDILHCPNCRSHYSENITKKPIQLESRDELIQWLIDIHNEVNKLTGKREYSYNEVHKKFDKMYQGKNTNSINIILIIFLALLIGYYYYINYYQNTE